MPLIARSVARVAVPDKLPVTLPVKLPEKPPLDVVTPVTITPKPFACALTTPPNFKADASIPVKSLPSPINFVAVTIPANVACPFVSIVTPVPTLMPLADVSNFFESS